MKHAIYVLLAAALLVPGASFDSASIKPSPPGSESSSSKSDAGYLTMRNVTLRRCIRSAYGFPEGRILEGPKWLDEKHYDIDARAEHPGGGMMNMLQALLAERFQLVLHKETRPLAGYALIITKGGMKAKISTPDAAGTPLGSRNGGPGRGGVGRTDNFHGFTMSQLAVRLTDSVGAPVEDATGLTEMFDFSLSWSPEDTQVNAGGAEFVQGLSLFTALQEQLGLKLEPRKVPTDMLIVDHAELPSEN